MTYNTSIILKFCTVPKVLQIMLA